MHCLFIVMERNSFIGCFKIRSAVKTFLSLCCFWSFHLINGNIEFIWISLLTHTVLTLFSHPLSTNTQKMEWRNLENVLKFNAYTNWTNTFWVLRINPQYFTSYLLSSFNIAFKSVFITLLGLMKTKKPFWIIMNFII